jgi:predicted nucleic acid-binding protein
MSSPFFLDTNVLLYASLQPDLRSDAARVLLARRGMISVQVLNEFANVARRTFFATQSFYLALASNIQNLLPTHDPFLLSRPS